MPLCPTLARMHLGGRFIVIDGPDGCGKSTQIGRLAEWIASQGAECVRAKDPGGTEIGDRIRHVLLGYDLSAMAPHCETLLFMASRAQLVAQVVRPALAQGKTVLGDRFISATCAYQGAAGFPREQVIEVGRWAVGETWPDLTIILDVPPEVGFARTGRTPQSGRRRDDAAQLALLNDARTDAMERRSLAFHRQVRANFLDLPRYYPRPVEIVDATPAPDAVFEAVRQAVERAFQ
ncbi:MAG: dTMP kinase [Phycisphaerae bacterium]|nr:dTMP kinase [Phycisphaerae bacterium]MCZ2400899.1 dTMP kinase [Phycisphaerae bacterium]